MAIYPGIGMKWNEDKTEIIPDDYLEFTPITFFIIFIILSVLFTMFIVALIKSGCGG